MSEYYPNQINTAEKDQLLQEGEDLKDEDDKLPDNMKGFIFTFSTHSVFVPYNRN